MDNYTIYCTGEQTKKALELGAPIRVETKQVGGFIMGLSHIEKHYIRPTAEQMLGWLEEIMGISTFHINYYPTPEKYGYLIIAKDCVLETGWSFNSRKEATLAAIDAALDYLLKLFA